MYQRANGTVYRTTAGTVAPVNTDVFNTPTNTVPSAPSKMLCASNTAALFGEYSVGEVDAADPGAPTSPAAFAVVIPCAFVRHATTHRDSENACW